MVVLEETEEDAMAARHAEDMMLEAASNAVAVLFADDDATVLEVAASVMAVLCAASTMVVDAAATMEAEALDGTAPR